MQSAPLSAPAAYSSKLLKQSPKLQTRHGPNGPSLVVTNSELVGDVTSGSTANEFTLTYADINPGLDDVFPWLHTQARGYEFYKFHKLHFHFLPSSTTSRDGLVTMGFDYDPRDPPPTTEQELFVAPGSVQGPCYATLCCKANPRALHNLSVDGKGLYIAKDPLGAEAGDPRLVFAAIFYIATSGFTDLNTTVGRLVVTYEVELSVPQSIDRSVSSGTFSVQRTAPARLLPRTGAIRQTLTGPIPITTGQRFPDAAYGTVDHKTDPQTGMSIDYRNLLQYFNSSSSTFDFKDGGRFKLIWDLIFECVKTAGAGSESEGQVNATVYKYTPAGGGSTTPIGYFEGPNLTNRTSVGAGHSIMGTIHIEQDVDTEPGDAVWIEFDPDVTNAPTLQFPQFVSDFKQPCVSIVQQGL